MKLSKFNYPQDFTTIYFTEQNKIILYYNEV